MTKPCSAASLAEMGVPVNSISMAFLDLTARETATPGVVQNNPIWTPGVAKEAVSAAMARSQEATSWQPAAVAKPCTCAITGWGSRRMASITPVEAAKTAA